MSETIVKNPGKNYLAAARRRRLRAALQTFCALLLTLIVVFPLYWMLISSLKSTDELLLSYPTFFPKELHFENYSAVFQKFPMGRFMFNSLIVSSLSAVLSVYFSTMTAYAIHAYDFKLKKYIYPFILMIMMIPTQVTALGFIKLVSNMNLEDSFIPLIVPTIAAPVTFFYMKQYMESTLPLSLIEAARIDGSGEFRTFNAIVMPLMKLCR